MLEHPDTHIGNGGEPHLLGRPRAARRVRPYFAISATPAQGNVKMISSFQASYRLWRKVPDKFLQFAFSGIREFSLYLSMYERLHANHVRLHKGDPPKFGDASVWLDFPPCLDGNGGSEVQGFKGWLHWRGKTVGETRRYVPQMEAETEDDESM
jgi:hypothetical protein